MIIFKRRIVILTLAVVGVVVLSSVSGGLTGAWMARRVLPPESQKSFFHLPNATTTGQAAQAATSTAEIHLVAMQMNDYGTRMVPETIFNRRSPVAILYFNKKGSAGESSLTQDEEVGRAAAVTADGWFVTTLSVMDGWHTADLSLWYDGHAYRVEQSIFDTATQAVFLKTPAKDLSVTPFADIWANRTGLAAWLEPSALEFVPSSILALRASLQNEPRSSERSDRRLVALGELLKAENGTPVWDAKGAMIGIVDSRANGRLLLIPGSALSASLQSLVSNGQVRHATLGVYVMDRTLVRSTVEDKTMPERGAWLREDKKTGRAIIKDSPAEKANLKSGDVILQVDRDILDGGSDLSDIILQYQPGANVSLRVWRTGKEMDVPVTLGTQVTSQPLP